MGATILATLNELIEALGNLSQTITVQGSQGDMVVVCCEDVPEYYDSTPSDLEVGLGVPPDPYEDWPTYEADRCKRAWTAILRVQTAMFQFYDKADIGSTITLGVATAILAIISAPLAIIGAIVALLIAGAFEYSTSVLRAVLIDLQEDLMCAIMESTTVDTAQAELDSVLAASDLDALSIQVVSLGWSWALLNGIFDGTLTIDAGVPEDCDCEEPFTCGGTKHFDTGLQGMHQPTHGTLEWTNEDYHDGPGGLRLNIPAMAGGTWTLISFPECIGETIGPLTAVNIWHKVADGGGTGARRGWWLKANGDDVYTLTAFTEGVWDYPGVNFGGHYGDQIAGLWYVFETNDAGEAAEIYLDELTIVIS